MNINQLIVGSIFLAVAIAPLSCDATNVPITTDDLDSEGFQKRIISIYQDYANNNLRCKIEVGKYTYFSYTGRCESCIDLCSLETPTTDCEKNCQVYLNDMKTNETNAQMIERLQFLQNLSYLSLFLIILMLVGLVSTIVYFFIQIRKVKNNFEEKLRGRPNGDDETDAAFNTNEMHPLTEVDVNPRESSDDVESAYESQRSFNRNVRD